MNILNKLTEDVFIQLDTKNVDNKLIKNLIKYVIFDDIFGDLALMYIIYKDESEFNKVVNIDEYQQTIARIRDHLQETIYLNNLPDPKDYKNVDDSIVRIENDMSALAVLQASNFAIIPTNN
jgi:hypothetical protein